MLPCQQAPPRPDRRLTAMAARKPRVLYLLQEYPQVSETYIANELEALWPSCDIRIVARTRASAAYKDHFPFTIIPGEERGALAAFAAEFRPDLIHACPSSDDLAQIAASISGASGSSCG